MNLSRPFIFLLLLFYTSCQFENEGTLQITDGVFESLDSKHTGITFENTLEYNRAFNIYTYRNFYNGGGVAIGDINNDGLSDL